MNKPKAKFVDIRIPKLEADPADDGPEVQLIRFFRTFPEGRRYGLAAKPRVQIQGEEQ